jgi:hypothetical protein
MSKSLSLALRVTADATGLRLDPVQRALASLGDQADKLTSQFDKFTASTPAAAEAQRQFAEQAQELISTLRDGGGATEFAVGFERLAEAATESAAAFAEAAAITERNRSAADKFDEAQTNLSGHLEAGRISVDVYNAEIEKLAKGLTAAEREARGLGPALEKAGEDGALKFNELSGIVGLLPGPFGALAARISSLSSSFSGIEKLFSADLRRSASSLTEQFTNLGSTLKSSFTGIASIFSSGGSLATGLSTLIGSVTALINPFTLAAAAIASIGFAASSIVSSLKGMEAETERLTNSAKKLGVSFEFLETLKQSAEQSGIEFGTVNAAMTRLLRTLAGADEESKKAAKSLEAVGLSFEDIKGKGSEEQIKLIGERLGAIEDPAKRAAAATAIFGRTGAELLPVFEGLDAGATTLDRFNARLNSLDRERVLALGDSFDALSASVRGIGNEVATPFIGVTQSITDGLASAFAVFGKNIGALLDAISPLTSAIGLAINIFTQFGAILSNVVGIAFEPAAAAGRILSSALDAISRAATEFAGRINDAINYVREFFQFNAAAETMNKLFKDLWDTVERVGTIISTAFSKGTQFLGDLVKRFVEFTGLSGTIQSIGSVISSVFGSVASVFGTIASAIGGTVGRLLSIAESFLGIDRSAKEAADSTQALSGSVEQLTEEEQKAAAEREQFLRGFTNDVSKAVDESAKFGKAGFDAAYKYQTAIADLQEQLDRGMINETMFAREAEKAKEAYNAQIDIAKNAAAEIEANTKRVDGLLAKANEIPKIEQDINAVDSEIARVESELAAARATGNTDQANALAARLAELDQLQSGLQDQADQAAQGFTEGFDKAFANVDNGINSLIDKSSEFGQAGFDAAKQLQDGIAAAQEQVRDGILTKDTFDKEVERQKELYAQRIDQLKAAEKLAQDITKKQEQLDEKQFQIALERAQELSTTRSGSVQINDLRSGGISAFFDTLKEDPAVAEAKKQTQELQAMRREIAKLNAEKVEILAGTG